jgi:hypothetical protein
MTNVHIPKEQDFECFVGATTEKMPSYERKAWQYLKELRVENLGRLATRHPDGFLKIQIGPENGVEDGQLRLHLWIPGREGTQQPHSHPWHLVSRALAGDYREHQPNLTSDKEGNGLSRYRVVYPPSQDSRNEVMLSGRETYQVTAGDLLVTKEGGDHALSAGPVHVSCPSGLGGVTLAVMSPRFRSWVEFYAPNPNPSPFSAEIPEEDLSRVVDLLTEIQKDL